MQTVQPTFATIEAPGGIEPAGLTLSGSTLISVTGYPGIGSVMGHLGSITFTTGVLSSPSLQKGGTFAAGGTFTIDGNDSAGLPSGVLFSGTFSGPVSRTLTTLANGTYDDTLTGVGKGSWSEQLSTARSPAPLAGAFLARRCPRMASLLS